MPVFWFLVDRIILLALAVCLGKKAWFFLSMCYVDVLYNDVVIFDFSNKEI